MSPFWDVAEPYFARLGVYSVADPTYGRWTLPHHPPHLELINDPSVTHQYRRVFLKSIENFANPDDAYESTDIVQSEDVELQPQELAEGVKVSNRWIVYSTWEMKDEPLGGWEEGGSGRGRDLVLVHGLSDYGLRYAPHVKHFLKAGFRVVIPDLPTYGRSTGVNSYLPTCRMLPAALHAVLTDLVRADLAAGRHQRKVFLSGASMGGWTVLYYLLRYPPTTSARKAAESPSSTVAKDSRDSVPSSSAEDCRIQVAGAYVLCPMVTVSKDSRPWMVTELIGRGIRYFAGAMPLAKSLRGKVSDDPRVEEDFFSDPLCYHGWLRVGTGLALLEGMTELDAKAEEINVPIRLVHGSSDRVTSHLGTVELYKRLPHQDKTLEIFEGYEHVMLKVGIDEADDEKRQRVLKDWRAWLAERC